MTPSKRKKFRSPKLLAQAFVDGIGMVTDNYYELYALNYDDEPVAVVDTTGSVGPVSGRTIWRIDVRPHPWAQEVSDWIWENLWEEPTEDTRPPDQNVSQTGWSCGVHVQIEY